jgi:regulator of sigma E protease
VAASFLRRRIRSAIGSIRANSPESMSFISVLKFIGILLEVLLIFNLLIIVHELGHFLAAKWRGLYIERFGIWFGKPIWEKKIGGIWYALGSIPAGGFVKLPQLAPMEALEGQTEIPKEQLKPISPLDKIIVAFAGPLFSFLLAIVFAVAVYQIGRPMAEHEGTVVIGDVEEGSPAEKVGLKPGDEIKSIDDIPVSRFAGQGQDAIMWRIVRSEGDAIKMTVKRDGQIQTFHPTPVIPDTAFYARKATRKIGIGPAVTPRVGEVKATGPAKEAGLQKGDLITHINDQELYRPFGISDYLRDHPGESVTLTVERNGQILKVPFKPGKPSVTYVLEDSPAARAGIKPGDRLLKLDDTVPASSSAVVSHIRNRGKQPLVLTVERGGTALPSITVTPAENADEKRLMIGAGFEDDLGFIPDLYGRGRTVHQGPWEQIRVSVGAIVSTIDAVASSKSDIKLQHMGGPVMMMNVYYRLFEQNEGWKLALWFSVLLNVNLALLNMLPLPVLDGGHITLAILEAIRRKPVNTRILEWIQTACALLIIGFMLFVTFYDVQDVFRGKGDKERFRYAVPAEAK